ncbi:hypothetical protein ACFFWC_20035 [Plantactinospora siamensis]|uniref:VCBS repeat-containing protein n=1 Tax=Plantactinospora siamensis TaxID=555372 RepID=A0ABV6P2Q7_9ACTN
MSTYRDPAARGDVFPSEEEIDPAGPGLDPVADRAAMADAPVAPSSPAPHPGGGAVGSAPVSPARSIIMHHADGSTEVATDLDGDGVADIVQIDLDGDGVPDVTYLDSDHDGRLDTVLGPDGSPRADRR